MRCFVGQCEVFVCLDFGHFFFFPLATKFIGPQMGCQFFKKKMLIFPTYVPLKQNFRMTDTTDSEEITICY